MTGKWTLEAEYYCRAFNVKTGTLGSGLRQIEIRANGSLKHGAGYYNFISTGAPTRIFGEGALIYAAGYNSGQTIKWKCSQNAISSPLTIECPVSMAWSTGANAPTDANGGTSFMPYFWHYGAGVVTFEGPDASNTATGLVWLASVANSTVECRTLGLRGTYGSQGDCDFRLANNATLRYTGAGETTDRTIIIQNGLPENATKAIAQTATLEQAGTGPLFVESALDASAGATLTLKNDTEVDATFAKAIEGDVNIVKSGSGTWKLSAANTYTGTTKVNEGSLYVCRGASLASSSQVSVGADAALVFEGGDEASAYSASVTASGVGASLVVGANATVTLALPSTASGTLDVKTADKTAKVKVPGASAGAAPVWLTINGNMAEFDADGNLKRQTVVIDETVNAYGGVIPSDGTKSVGIVTGGEPAHGPVTLAQDATAVATLAQKAQVEAVVDVAEGKTLTANRLYVEEDAKDMVVGGAGTLKLTGNATLWTDDPVAKLTVASALDLSGATSVAKAGSGEAVLSGIGTYAKTVTVAAGTLAVSNLTQLAATLSGSGTFVKRGTDSLTVSKKQSDFAGDFVAEGGVLTPGTANMTDYFGPVSGGALVITNGAALNLHTAAGSDQMQFGAKEIRISGDGPDGLGALVQNKDLSSSPLCRVTLDGDASMSFPVPGTKSSGFTSRENLSPVLNMNGHTLTKNGYGRLIFGTAVVTNMGPIVLTDVDPQSNGDWRNFLVLNSTDLYFPEGKTSADAPITVGNGARVTFQNTKVIPVPLEVTGTNVQMATFDGRATDLAYDNWTGPVNLVNEDSLLELYQYGDVGRRISIHGQISGKGSIQNVQKSAGISQILCLTNTYEGATRFSMPSGSGSYGSVTFAGPRSIPDYSKAFFDYYGTINLRFAHGDDGGWTAADMGRLLREATWGEHDILAAVDTTNCGDVTVDAADLGDVSASRGGVAPYGTNVVTLTGALDMPYGRFGAYRGTLKFSGPGVRNFRSFRISGEKDASVGRVEIADGADVRVAAKPAGETASASLLIGTHDNSIGYLKVANAKLSADGSVIFGNCTKSRAVLEVGEGAEVSLTQYNLGNATGCYGGAIYLLGGRFTTTGVDYIGLNSTGYVEVDGGDYRSTSGDIRLGSNSNSVGVVAIKSGTFTQAANAITYLGLDHAYGRIYMTGGEFVIASNNIQMCHSHATRANSEAVITLSGPEAKMTFASPDRGIQMGNQTDGFAAINLNGGTLKIGYLYRNTDHPTTRGAFINFNGGALQAARNNTVLFRDMTRVTVYGGGATIDTDGHDVTPAVPLEAPAAGCVTAIPWDPTCWDAFIGSPCVAITGDGEGATAYAEFDRASGRVTSIVVTSPGQGYTWAKARIWYGGNIVPKENDSNVPYYKEWIVDCTVDDGALPSGGLVKAGEGTLTLTQTNTYTGATVVAGGVLRLGAADVLPNSSVVLRGGTVEAAKGVDLPATLTVDAENLDFSDSKRKYVLANLATGAATPQVAVIGTLPPYWEVVRRGNRLILRCQHGNVMLIR